MVLIAVLVGVFTSAPTLAEEVYYCTDAKVAGIAWDEKDPQGDGRVTSFTADRHTMKVVSKTRRRMIRTTGDTAGRTLELSCSTFLSFGPPLVLCESSAGIGSWLFSGDRYTRAAFFASVLVPMGSPNIYVAHGTCVKF